MKSFIVFLLITLSTLTIAKRSQLPDLTLAKVSKVFKANENLHAAFFEYDGKKVESNAAIVKQLADKVNNKLVRGSFETISKNLSMIKASNSVEKNNELYSKVSLAFGDVLNKYDIGKDYNVYSCPMVKKKWVQNSSQKKRVHNPYAPEMPHCGQRDTDY